MRKLESKNEIWVIDLTKDLSNCLPPALTLEKLFCHTSDKIFYVYYFIKTAPDGLVIVFVNSINGARKLKNILTCR